MTNHLFMFSLPLVGVAKVMRDVARRWRGPKRDEMKADR